MPDRFRETVHNISRPVLPDGSQNRVHQSFRPERQGDPLRMKLRIVCVECNSGWMSRLQTAAKPHLLPLLRQDWTSFTEEAGETLAAWTAMTATVVGYADPPTASSHWAERVHLMEHSRAPENWDIWMAPYFGEQNRSFRHTAIEAFGPHGRTYLPDAKGFLVTLRIGGLALIVLRTPFDWKVEGMGHWLESQGVRSLWPPQGPIEKPFQNLNDETAVSLHEEIKQRITLRYPLKWGPVDLHAHPALLATAQPLKTSE